MHARSSNHRGFLVPTFAPLRASIWAVLGLSAAACGGNVSVQSSGGGGGEGGEGGSTSTGPTTSSTSTGTVGGVCPGAVPIPQANGAYSGYAQCPDGSIHRIEAVACDTSVQACDLSEANISCTSDAQCTGAPNGRCAHQSYIDFDGSEITACGCVYPCAEDKDCGGNQVCVCAGVVPKDPAWPACAPASCLTGKDCPTGECGITSYNDGCSTYPGLACRAPGDACRLHSDCPPDYDQCATFGDGVWSCQGYGCAVGRPLLVGGRARTAGRAARADWSDAAIAPEVAGLSAEVRAALATHWREVAAMEHASVGSFARFSLELLALGAPPDLLAGAQQAAADEIGHARVAYALASAYAGRAIGPAPLDVRGVAPATSVTAIVTALVEEACVGETVGAAEARALAGLTGDPTLAATFERIAEEEGRHAELGWSTLAWLLRGAGEELRAIAADAFEQAIARMRVEPESMGDVVAPEHGLLSAEMLGAIRRQALAEVVEPCARAVVAPPARAGSGASEHAGGARAA